VSHKIIIDYKSEISQILKKYRSVEKITHFVVEGIIFKVRLDINQKCLTTYFI